MPSTVSFSRVALLSTALALTSACGGGGAPGTSRGTAAGPAQATSFTITVPRDTNSAARRTAYVSSASRSIVIALNTVNGLPIPPSSSSAVTSSLVGCTAGCSVPGPVAPQGNDVFAFSIYDGDNGTGNLLGSATVTLLVIAGGANSAPVTVLGAAGKLAISGVPVASAGTPIATAPLTVTVQDAAGKTITGTYAAPISIASSNVSGAVALSVNGGNFGTSVKLASSTDTVQIAYSGAAVAPVTLTASGGSAPNATATFAPVLAPLAYTGPLAGNVPTIHLPTGGSAAGFTVAETGYSGSPYSNVFTATAAAGCASLGTVSPASGTAFTVTAIGSPTPGTCTVTVADSLGQTLAVTVTNP